MKEFTDQEVNEIRSCEMQMDSNGDFPGELLHIIYEKQLFKLFVPENLGGRMVSLPESVRIFEEASAINGSFGWLVTIGSGGGFFAGNMKEEVVADVFQEREAVIAGSGAPTGTAEKCEGGYRVTGEWKYCSGAEFATTFTASALISGAGEEPEMRAFAFTPEQAEVIEDWNAFGLKATGSHTFRVKDVFVPVERTFSVFESNGLLEAPVFTYPFEPFAQASFTAVVLGLGRRLMEEARYYDGLLNPDSPKKSVLAGVLEEQEARMEELSSTFYSTIEGNWDLHLRGESADDQYNEVGTVCARTAQGVREAAFSLYPYLGMYASDQDTPFNRVWRDLLTASQHALISPYR
ncbi:acyl-CoA dehydrogenase [Bacillus salacetis]|uniref:Acyl-CoA dehydrogenase n=1 Tax=Bacillus salacetis TaxID=2315464 RepID=A0A3A1QRM3_9BACI|nr:acyl-CoA dehydrogenase family protein [Bacillus salacetis]RIW29193.1 acyl-CoA dehydrogenase [Bacillus salacetis]